MIITSTKLQMPSVDNMMLLLGEWQRLNKVEYDQENGRDSTR
jgi:thiamine phosphate synthase YjbQ (UPF0047 family)